MILKNLVDRKTYIEATKISTEILRKLYEQTELGRYPIEIDELAFKMCKKYDVKPAFYGVGDYGNKYKNATCISVNEVVVHGIPRKDRVFVDGDIIKVDFGIIYQGFYTDHCYTVGLGKVKSEDLKLLKVGKEAVWLGANQAKAGNRIGDIGFAMRTYALNNNCDTVKEYTGHGIGKKLHDEPVIPSFGNISQGKLLNKGMVLCIESQIISGDDDGVFTDSDGWTVKTINGNKAVMFEFMVIVDDKPEILTRDTYDWQVIK